MTTRKNARGGAQKLDNTTRPQDDFFGYVNNVWLSQNPIPDDKSRWGTFDVLQDEAWKNLRKLYEALHEDDDALMGGTVKQQIRDLYYTATHMDALEAQHLQDVRNVMAQIEAVTDIKDFATCLGGIQSIGVEAPWNIWVDSDNKDSTQHLLHFSQDGLTLPNRDYYLSDEAAMADIRQAYQKHLVDVYGYFPELAGDAQTFAQTIFNFEKAIAEHSRTDAALREIEDNYHKTPFTKVKSDYPAIDWQAYADALGWKPDDKISIDQPEFFEFINSQYTQDNLAIWKIYLKWHFLVRYYSRISEQYALLKFEFFGITLSGTKKIMPVWKRAMHVVDEAMGEAAGKLYVERYFAGDAKQQVIELVEMVRTAYAARIKRLEWMDEKTKDYALTKLKNIKVLAGYPDVWRDYSGLQVGRTSLIANIMAAERYNNRYYLARLHQPTSRDEWFMFPQTVNAYHDPNRLVLCFPAAILQSPFFDQNADIAVKLGAIGAVIGHEFTHGFDDQGCQFDAEGNVRTWQTDQDRAVFAKRANIIIEQADNYEVLPGLHMQGKLVIGESIADLGGIEIAFEALQMHLADHPGEVIDGLSPQQRFFIAGATCERDATRDEKKREYALTDPHPDSMFRVNGILQHVDGFYEAFGITKGDKLFRPDRDRARIW